MWINKYVACAYHVFHVQGTRTTQISRCNKQVIITNQPRATFSTNRYDFKLQLKRLKEIKENHLEISFERRCHNVVCIIDNYYVFRTATDQVSFDHSN